MMQFIELGTVAALLSSVVIWMTRYIDRLRRDQRALLENHLKHHTEALSKVTAALDSLVWEIRRAKTSTH